MGIDYHALRFLQHAFKQGPFGAVATIGRQGLHVPPWRVRRALGLANMVDFGDYCEPLLLQHFGAEQVDSYDYSDYEGATFTADMNQPLTPTRQYDTVIDAGSTEHVYNAPQALRNVSELTKVGGQILHILPANGFCGHGFWQFSPQLFFSLYSEGNGYGQTEVFVADLADERAWYQVKRPHGERRADVVTSKALHVLVRTRLLRPFSHASVQQSDYAHEWARKSPGDPLPAGGGATAPAVPRAGKPSHHKLPVLYWVGWLSLKKLKSLWRPTSLSSINPSLTRISLGDDGTG
jgi:hypothetical protein